MFKMSYTGPQDELKGMPIAICASCISLSFYSAPKYAAAIDYTKFGSTASSRSILMLNFATAAGSAANGAMQWASINATIRQVTAGVWIMQMGKRCTSTIPGREWTKEEMMAYLDWTRVEDERVERVVAQEMGDNPLANRRRGMKEIWKRVEQDMIDQQALYSNDNQAEDCIIVS
ncbi:unnamed protein product, partial [Fusarium langsethiae]